MVYSQYALLRMVIFLDKVQPPPNLDPLMVRATVTMNEIVRERILGAKRSNQLQAHQQLHTSIKVGELLECYYVTFSMAPPSNRS